MALTTSIAIALSALRSVPMSGSSAQEKHTRSNAYNWPDGSGASQADQVWSDDRSLAVGTETHDLRSLTQLDDNGATVRSSIAFANLKALLIRNTLAAGATGRLRIGGAGSGPWEGTGTPFQAAGSKIDIEAGGVFLWTNPAAAGGSTGGGARNLLIEAIGATTTYEIVAIGDST